MIALNREEGLEEGMEKGKAEGKAEVVKRMLSLGLSDELIIEAVNISLEKLNSLRSA
ncbi:MAG: hypothetical protein ACK5LT_04915 [Lachnospirales bacterium]